jgi:hypothetical protein
MVHLLEGRLVEIMSMLDLKEARCVTYIYIEHVCNSMKEICFNALNLPCVSFLYMCMDFFKYIFSQRIYKLISENLPITLAQFAKTNKTL